MYIVVEGKDLAGKGFFIKKITKHYAQFGKEVVLVTEPHMGHYTGQLIREFLAKKTTDSNELYDLYKTNRNYLYNDVIRPALEAGKIVISDRNFVSSMVYQANIGMFNILKDNPKNIPDIIYYVSITHETYLERLKQKKGLEVIEKELANATIFDNFTRRYKEALATIERLTNTVVINVKGD